MLAFKCNLFYLYIVSHINFSDLSNPIKLGEGTFGEVFRVNYKGEIVALKVRFEIVSFTVLYFSWCSYLGNSYWWYQDC